MRERRVLQVLLVLMAVSSAGVGFWAQFAPKSWYEDFPGAGRHWVAPDGPYNEHLVRDVGGLNLALFAATVIALATASLLVAQAAALGAVIYGIPHLVYHASHLDLYDTIDKVGNVVALGLNVLVPLVVLVLARQAASNRQELGANPSTSP